ncbi:HAMP domain-containing protein [Halalkalibacter hemicellulosilyticus]|uniref:histidine kinase n=1 Tax=Halalkalibacter hemicellulosilyticusJCM 9152 TaxID=1236971 RepID=W4QAX4_9BACI|nr:HAMP domain-containing protein [Halalkalibacter hemicellulosilyticus]GAE28823.1 two-component sensor histidine kinase [Halalkalibacter hemicellulosilyticusJCM 9152]
MKSFFHKLTIKNKIFITFAFTYVIVITVIGVLMYVTNVNEMKNQTQSMSKVLTTQFSRTIDMYFEDIERLSMAIFTDSTIQTTLSNYEESILYNDITIRNVLYPRLFTFVYPHDWVVGVELYTNTGTVFDYRNHRNLSIRYDTQPHEWMLQLNEMDKIDFTLLPTTTPSPPDEGVEHIVSLVRHVYEIPQRNKIGSIKIDIDLTVFEELLEIENVEELEEHMRVIVVDDDMNVIYDQNNQLIGQQSQELATAINSSQHLNDGVINWQSSRFLYTDNYSDFTNWNMLVLIENDFIVFEQKQILFFVVITGVITITIIALISYYLSYGITRPFAKLMNKMKRVERGNLSAHMKETQNPEIDVLVRFITIC